MHYYKRNIGDYHKKAGRLSLLQHGVYTLLIDSCYDREQFPTKEQAIDWVWASTSEEIEAVEFVLKRFFELVDGVYIQNRVKEEIEAFQQKSVKNRQIALEREEKRKERTRNVHETLPNKHEAPPNHKPITNNHKPNKDIYPYQTALDAYHEVIDQLSPNWAKVQVYDDARKRLVKKAISTIKPRAEKLNVDEFEYFRNLLEAMATDPFFSGLPSQRNQEGFRCKIETNLNPKRLKQAIDQFAGEA